MKFNSRSWDTLLGSTAEGEITCSDCSNFQALYKTTCFKTVIPLGFNEVNHVAYILCLLPLTSIFSNGHLKRQAIRKTKNSNILLYLIIFSSNIFGPWWSWNSNLYIMCDWTMFSILSLILSSLGKQSWIALICIELRILRSWEIIINT